MGRKAEQELLAKLHEWADDPDLFKAECICIQDRETGATIPFDKPKVAQVEYRKARDRSRKIDILKARREGITTDICADFLHKALFNENFGVCVAAHTGDSTETIFSIYKFMYSNLPPLLKRMFPLQPAYGRKLVFPNGSFIRALTAGSDAGHGDTFRAVHASEYARWRDPIEAAKSTFGAIADKNTGIVIIETTANGVNHFKTKWERTDGALKLFIPWFIDRKFRAAERVVEPDQRIVEMVHEHGLDEYQMNWAVNTLNDEVCQGSWNVFNEQYPSTADIAFVTTGSRFFLDYFEGGRDYEGLEVYDQFTPEGRRFRTYSLGADVASGAPGGDYSAAAVLDVTDPENPVEAATFMRRMPTNRFADALHEMLLEPFEPIAVIERTGGWGIDVIQRLEEKGWGQFYIETIPAKVGSGLTTRIGYTTSTTGRNRLISRASDFINRERQGARRFTPKDPRFRYQANTFIHTDSGKIEHDVGCKDDMVFAYLLALAGIDQADFVALERETREPRDLWEVAPWEAATGKLYDPEEWKDDTPVWRHPLDGVTDFW